MEEVQEDKQVGTPPISSRELNRTVDFICFSNLQGYTGLGTCHVLMRIHCSCDPGITHIHIFEWQDEAYAPSSFRSACGPNITFAQSGHLTGFAVTRCIVGMLLRIVFSLTLLYFSPIICLLPHLACRKLQKISRRKGQMMTKA